MDLFKNKVIVITGASSGIGKALAQRGLALGGKVAICARNMDKLVNSFEESVRNKMLFFKADVSAESDCQAFIEAVINRWGTIDILINNAGISMRALFEDTDIAVIKELMEINFWGMVYCTKYALPYILHSKGTIAGISSIAGYRGLPGRTGYSASKFAMQGFLEALRTELLHSGVNVMWVSPGFTASNIRNVALNAYGNQQAETPLEESKLMSAESCAEKIFAAISKRKRTIVMTSQGKLTVWMNKLFAGLADKLVYDHFAKEPGSPLTKTNK